MRQLRFLLALILGTMLAFPASAERLSLAEISAYLNKLKSAEGRFTQINADGSKSTGKILIRRPGRVRFEYDPPESALVVADGSTVGIIDPRSNDGPQGYPLNQTPLNLILARNVDLTRARMVRGQSSDGNTTTVHAQDPKYPENGTIEIMFSANPIAIRQWVINDSSGERTTVILSDLRTGVILDDRNFVIPGKERIKIDR